MAALVEKDAAVVETLRQKLVAPTTTLSQKYRILFSLRGIAGQEAHAAMLEGARATCMLLGTLSGGKGAKTA